MVEWVGEVVEGGGVRRRGRRGRGGGERWGGWGGVGGGLVR